MNQRFHLFILLSSMLGACEVEPDDFFEGEDFDVSEDFDLSEESDVGAADGAPELHRDPGPLAEGDSEASVALRLVGVPWSGQCPDGTRQSGRVDFAFLDDGFVTGRVSFSPHQRTMRLEGGMLDADTFWLAQSDAELPCEWLGRVAFEQRTGAGTWVCPSGCRGRWAK